MEPHLIFMDIDGTLVDNHQNISKKQKKSSTTYKN